MKAKLLFQLKRVSQTAKERRVTETVWVSMRVTATLNFHHQLKEGAIPPEVDGVPQILPFVGSPPKIIEMQKLNKRAEGDNRSERRGLISSSSFPYHHPLYAFFPSLPSLQVKQKRLLRRREEHGVTNKASINVSLFIFIDTNCYLEAPAILKFHVHVLLNVSKQMVAGLLNLFLMTFPPAPLLPLFTWGQIFDGTHLKLNRKDSLATTKIDLTSPLSTWIMNLP